MRSTEAGKLAMIGALALILGGCGSVTFAPGGLMVGASGGSGYNLSPCAMVTGYSPEATRMGVRTSPAMAARAIQARINRIQALASFGYTARSTESWKRVATGEC